MSNKTESKNILFPLVTLCGVCAIVLLLVLWLFSPCIFPYVGCILSDQVFQEKNLSLMKLSTEFIFPLFAGFSAFVFALFGLWLSYRRSDALLRQANIAKNQITVTAFKKAVDQLAHKKQVVRLGGIYALHEIARNEEKYRQVVANILCAYVREVTNDPEYQNKMWNANRNNQSNTIVIVDDTIQTIINLLFGKVTGEKWIYDDCRRGKKKYWCCLVGAFLHGVWLYKCDLSKVDLWKADLRGTNLSNSDLRNTDIGHADLRAANLYNTQVNNETVLEHTKLQGVRSTNNDEQPDDCIRSAIKMERELKADFLV